MLSVMTVCRSEAPLLYLCCMCKCGLHAVLWSHIGILMRSLAEEPCSTKGLSFPSVSRRNAIADTVFDGVGLAGFVSRVNAFLLA